MADCNLERAEASRKSALLLYWAVLPNFCTDKKFLCIFRLFYVDSKELYKMHL